MKETGKQLKFALIGTSASGKTSLLEELKKKHVDNSKVVFVNEAAREFFLKNNKIPDRFSTEIQSQVQDLVLDKEKSAHMTDSDIIFCDRSVVDAAVYRWAHGDREGAEELLKKVEAYLPTYHMFLLLNPADIPYQIDNIRQESEDIRNKFHQAYIDFFNEKNIPYELLGGTIEERLKRVEEILKKIE